MLRDGMKLPDFTMSETKRMINAFPKIEVNRSHNPQTESQVHDLTRKSATCIGEGVISKQQQQRTYPQRAANFRTNGKPLQIYI